MWQSAGSMGEYLEVNVLKTYFERRGSGDPTLLLHGGEEQPSRFPHRPTRWLRITQS
jgi:hypothetical protein